MNEEHKITALRLLMVIASPKVAQKALGVLRAQSVPVRYQFHAYGTASNEIADLLGLGNIEKIATVCMLPKTLADDLLKKLRIELRLDSVNSGIAFTMPISSGNHLMLQMLSQLDTDTTRKDGATTMKNAMIAAIVNQGFSEEVMHAARAAGASGGTVLHSHRSVSDEAFVNWGLSTQDERDIVLILSSAETKLAIMQAISDQCGMRSDAKGIVISLPVDGLIGLSQLE